MEKDVKEYAAYAKTLSFDELVGEGRKCISKVTDSVKSTETESTGLANIPAGKMLALAMGVFNMVKADDEISDKEMDFVTDTTGVNRADLEDLVADVDDSFEGAKAMAYMILKNFKTSDEVNALIRYCVLLSAVDGDVSFIEKSLTNVFGILEKAVSIKGFFTKNKQ